MNYRDEMTQTKSNFFRKSFFKRRGSKPDPDATDRTPLFSPDLPSKDPDRYTSANDRAMFAELMEKTAGMSPEQVREYLAARKPLDDARGRGPTTPFLLLNLV
jgi:hypothetical protein